MPIFLFADTVVYFTHVPKTGGSSIEAALRKLGGRQALLSGSREQFLKCTPQHMHGELVERFVPRGFRDYTFLIHRHPVDRLVSEYRMRSGKRYKDVSFDNFVSQAFDMFETNGYAFDNHIRPQVEFLTDDAHTFRFEDGLMAPVRAVCQACGLLAPQTLDHNRKGSSDIDVVPTERTLERIRQFYEKDFATFGYE